MDFYLKIVFQTLAINLFFKKSFQINAHLKSIIFALILSHFVGNFSVPGNSNILALGHLTNWYLA